MGDLVHFLRSNKMASLGVALLALILLAVLVGPYFYEVSPNRLNILKRLAPPGADFWLGTDSLGRDVLARLLHGGRVTLVVGCGVVALAFAVGVTIGIISGFAGGWVDRCIMRLADAMLSFPSLVLAIALAAAFGPSLENAMLAVAITLMPQFARVARGQAVSVSVKPYVDAAVTLGLPKRRILLRYVFANSVGPLMVQATLALGAAILQTASLGFLGLGAQPPAAEWGADVSINLDFVRSAPWVALVPGAGILLTVMAFNLIGDGLAEWMDPRRRPMIG
jgi:peptide/nickel transport system permease protein